MLDWGQGVFGEVWVGAEAPVHIHTTASTNFGLTMDTPYSRASELLRKNLPEKKIAPLGGNLNVYPNNGSEQIDVQGGKSGFWYRLIKASQFRVYVYLLDPRLDGYAMSFCVYSWEAAHNLVVWQDEMLMFALYLQHAEEHFLRTAIAHPETMRMRTFYQEAIQKACYV